MISSSVAHSGAPLLFPVALVLLAVFLIGLRPEPSGPPSGSQTAGSGGLHGSSGNEAWPGTEGLVVRAGRGGELTARSVTLARMVGTVLLPLLSMPVAGLLPGRLGLLTTAGLAGLGFLAPNLILERAARRRMEKIVAGLPDTLDLLSVQLGAGRSIGSAMSEFSRSGRGPLAVEMGIAAGEIERGMSQSHALQRLRRRTGGREVAAFCATVERSRRLGSPLAVELERQASAGRVEQRRAVTERAARAAPKIQLVIALVLVPAVMLLVAAALVANSDRLLGFAFG